MNLIFKSLLNEDKSKVRIKRKINRLGTKAPNGRFIVFLTVSDDQSKTYVIRGGGRNVRNAIREAINNYVDQKPKSFNLESLKLDILTDYERVEKELFLNKTRMRLDRGLEGLAFGEDFHTAFLPGEVIGYNIFKKRRVNVRNSFRALFNHLPSTFSSFTEPLDKQSPTDVYKIKTKEYYINKDKYFELYRGHRIYSTLDKKELTQAIELTKNNYFKNVVNRRGKFIYSFLPYENRRESRYNILRHAGTIYSMLEVYEIMPDEELLKSIKRAFKFLTRSIKPFTINGKEVKVVVERDIQKVGGNALAIVALAKYTEITGDEQYISLMQDLASWLRENQDERGEFIIHKQQHSTGEAYDFISHYYPGEAILGLARLYQIDKQEQWLDVAEDAAKFLINIRDNDCTVHDIAHDHWLLYGLNDLYRERKNQIYLDHSIFISEAIMRTQITEQDASRKELIGGYVPKSGNDPSSTPVACRSEGLSAAYRLARDFGHVEIAERMLYAISQGIKYQLQMQYRPESVLYFRRKRLALGAVHASFRNYSMRNDFTQHSLSSFVALYKILKEENKNYVS